MFTNIIYLSIICAVPTYMILVRDSVVSTLSFNRESETRNKIDLASV